MKSKILSLLALFAIVLGIVAYGQTVTLAATPSWQERPLRLSEPVEAIVIDLEKYIPEYIHEKDIPGVAIALIRDGKVVWTEGFGIVNTIITKPTTSETLFEVASNSKVVTAYIALRLVDQGRLSLDEPLNTYLPEPWLPPSEYRNAVTLRQVLSHTSGLGANITLNRDILFVPGSHYYYSGIGFMYLQKVIEQVTSRGLEDLAQEMVFAPLGMSSSSFVNQVDFTTRTANGHLHAFLPALLFVVPYVVSLVLVGFLGLVILRILTGQWKPTRRMVIGACTVAFVLSLLPILILLRPFGFLEFVWLIAFCGLILTIVFALLFFAGRAIILWLSPKRPGMQIILTIVWIALIVVGLTTLVFRVTNLPVPKWPMKLSRDLSWGLGPGIQHSQQGDALWQWGQHFDFQSAMIIYPEHGFGVIVLTNNDLLNSDVAIEIAHRALGGKIETIRRAIHLQFNYSKGD